MPPESDPTSPREPDRHFRTDLLRDNLARRSVRGMAVTVAGQAVKFLIQCGSIIILARLLSPEAFGLIAMVAVVLAFLELFKDLGLSAATVQREHISHAEVSTLFWLNVALGAIAAVVNMALAPALAWFFDEPALVDIALVLSVAIVIGGLGTQHLALLRRQMRFSVLMLVQMGAEILAMAAAVCAALAGADYWALVIQRIVWSALLCIGGWIKCDWRPDPPWRVVDVRSLLGFGGNVTGSNLVGFVTRNLDQVLIGWYWGAAALGFYERAYKLLLVPVNNLNAPLFTVLMPTLSRVADQPQRYRRAYMEALEKLTMTTMPCAAVVIVIPDWIVTSLFGSHWSGAAPILSWLGIAMLFQPVSYTGGWLFMSQNRTREMFYWGLLSAGLSVAAIIVGLPYGPAAVAAVWSVSGLFLRVPMLFWIVGRRGPVRAMNVLQCLIPGGFATFSICIILSSLRASPLFEGLTPAIGTVVSVAIAGGIALLCYLSIPQGRNAMRGLGRLYRILIQQDARV